MHDQTDVRVGVSKEDQLIFMIGEELKKPLTTIKVLAETSEDRNIQLEARKALRTIDNILLYQRLQQNQTVLITEPIHVGSILHEVSHDLKNYSFAKGCETEIDIQPSLEAVDAEHDVLRAGITSLWQAMIAMTSRPSPLSWEVTRTQKRIRISAYNNSLDLDKVHLQQTDQLSRQPYAGVAGPATDLYVAQKLFTLLRSNLRKTKKHDVSGLTLTLPISKQLSLV